MAPIDPLQLLKALGSLLSEDGGIKSGEEVGKLSRFGHDLDALLIVLLMALKSVDLEMCKIC